ncbi:MAG: GerMN domain-containing protein [Xylanivirga thermophila]|jgi:spore germination protein GerM|uniref:GerMN domain-containing protein n=1 Tax=Xylanivirga thermophila TaxID=2496273 RepID=UPI00101C20F5|nr:GerMN domain-containing protein [Xylanivirga thermophila]
MKKSGLILILVLMILISSGCGHSVPPDETNDNMGTRENKNKIILKDKASDRTEYSAQNIEDQDDNMQSVNVTLYFLDNEKKSLVSESKQLTMGNSDQLISKTIQSLILGPKSPKLAGVLPKNVVIEHVELCEDTVTVDFSAEFLQSPNLLASRVALVNTLTDLDGVQYVKICVEGQELTANGKKDGPALGLLSKYTNSLEEVAAQETNMMNSEDIREVESEIYFKDAEGRYLLPEIRPISIKNKEYAKAIVDSLIKGPSSPNSGLYPTISSDVQLLDIKLVKAQKEDEKDGLELYFSKEFKKSFPGGSSSELTALGSIVYSLTSLPNVEWIQIYYEDGKDNFTNKPIGNMDLTRPLKRDDFGDILGRRIKVYFSDKDSKYLVTEYRAIGKNDKAIARHIIEELIKGPVNNTAHMSVIPKDVKAKDINVWVSGQTIIVDLPAAFNEKELEGGKDIMSFYAIVNSLTDPVNTKGIKQVQFLVEGKKIENFKNTTLNDPFVRNPALINEDVSQ